MDRIQGVDPRDIITPEAFVVAPELLGLPLARPWRRGAALAIDAVFVWILSNLTGMLFVIAAAWVLYRAGGRTSSVGANRPVRRRVFRLAAAAIFLWIASSAFNRLFGRGEDKGANPEKAGAAALADVEEVKGESGIAIAGEMLALRESDSAAVLARVLADAADGADSAQVAAMRGELFRLLAADTVARLQQRAERLDARVDGLRAELAEAREERGFIDFIREAADELGLGFGWTALYFTAFLVLWRGQTPGKRLLHIRVLRLDGKPIGWWCSFERFGGYVAGVFTGLLDYFLLVRDRNRQALHDKIVDTVVIWEGVERPRDTPGPVTQNTQYSETRSWRGSTG